MKKIHDSTSLTCRCKTCKENWRRIVKNLKPSPVILDINKKVVPMHKPINPENKN